MAKKPLQNSYRKSSKILIVGYGSIGKRHFDNLVRLGYSDILICTKNSQAKRLVKQGIKIFPSLDLALKEKPDVSIICNETSMHTKTAIQLAKNGSHLFIEKPLSDSMKDLKNLIKIVTKKKLITMVGCNMRFHDGIKLIKKLVDKNEIGRIFSISVENGSFMPDWHPWEDYQISYASRKKLGGGVVLTQIHEIDYLCWLFGTVSEVFSFSKKLSDLQIDVEDYSGSLLKFKNKIIAEVHLDYFQKPSVRSCKIHGTKGKIVWNWENNHLQVFRNTKNKFFTKHFDKNFDRNKMYLEELQYFLNCIDKKKQPMNSISESIEIQKVALAIKHSAKVGKKIQLK